VADPTIRKVKARSAPKYDPNAKFFTLWEMSLALEIQPASLSRWVRQWFDLGDAPITRGRKGTGFIIPGPYALVGRGWRMTKDSEARQAMLSVLPDDPKPWIITVGNVGVTCYTATEASQQVTKILTTDTDQGIPEAVKVFNVGEIPDPQPKKR
jgi:hypothetical protein